MSFWFMLNDYIRSFSTPKRTDAEKIAQYHRKLKEIYGDKSKEIECLEPSSCIKENELFTREGNNVNISWKIKRRFKI